MSNGRRVVVSGATGHTSSFVVEELRHRGFVPVAVGCDSTKLAHFIQRGIEAGIATIDDAHSLDQAFSAASAVINCAGPFLDTADAVGPAALRAGAYYLDVTAEQASALATLEVMSKSEQSAVRPTLYAARKIASLQQAPALIGPSKRADTTGG